MKRYNKVFICSDLHLGRKQNSTLHNEDCLNFIKWFCEQVRNDPAPHDEKAVMFMGDWHESRSALNIHTLHYSYSCAEQLNMLQVPVFFIVGNHDLYYRHSRKVFSTLPFREFKNIELISEPQKIKELGGKGSMVFPYMFEHEYEQLHSYEGVPTWFGHFEFKDFIITGYNIKMERGPDANEFDGPNKIFTGHFHKRQTRGNVHYIGNCFPLDFSDAGDSDRGMAIYTFKDDKVEFKNWEHCPTFIKTKLSILLQKGMPKQVLRDNSYVRCLADEPVTYEQSLMLQERFVEKFKLRDFSMEESMDKSDTLSETESSVDEEEIQLSSVDDLVVKMLKEVDNKMIDEEKLVKIYEGLRVD